MSGSSRGQVWRVARYRNRASFRRRVGGYVSLVVLIALLGGIAMASIAAARSTQSSFPRFMRGTNPSDLNVVDLADAESQTASTLIPKLARLPLVKHVASWGTPDTARLNADGTPQVDTSGDAGGVFPVVSADGFFTEQDKATVVQGRALDPAHEDEIEVSALAARVFHVPLGGSARVGFYATNAFTEPGFDASSTHPVFTVTLHVVGIVKFNNTVVQDDIDRLPTFVVYSPKLAKRLIACCHAGAAFAGLQLEHGARDVPAVEAEIARELPGATVTSITSVQIAKAERAVEPESIALGVFGGIAALAALLVAGQTMARQVRLSTDERAVLRALGASPATAIADGLLALIVVIVIGAFLAAIIAVACSPLAPLGPVRSVAHVHVTFDWTVLGAGVLGLVLLLCGIATALAVLGAPHRVARRRRRTRSASRWIRTATGSGFSPAAVTGITFAVEPGSGANAAPVRSAIVGCALAVVVLVATLVFGASLSTLVRRPALYGWNWNDELRSGYGGISNIPQTAALPALRGDPSIAAFTPVYFATLQVGALTVPVLGAPPHAAIGPSLLSGHGVEAANQIVVAPGTLAELHARVGGTITAGSGKAKQRLRIVGTAALPAVGVATNLHMELATGAIVATSAISKDNRGFGDQDGPEGYLVRLKPGVSAARAAVDLQRDASAMSKSPDDGPVSVLPVQRPAEIVNYRTMGKTPALLGGGLALGAVAALGLTLVASVRRRRRDLALLKTLGFTRRQLGAVIAWQASVAAVIGAIGGVPLGVLVGRAFWNRFATAIHVVPRPTVPGVSLVLVAIGALVLANLVAALPGRHAARTTTAVLLRSE